MQKKNRKGFTLIELLAVIVILTIIVLIAVPVIMNVITKARKSAFEDSAYGIVKAGEMYYTNELLEIGGMTKSEEFIVDGSVFKNSEGKTLEISGSLPSSGKVTVTSEGKVAIAISNGEYCIRKATTESSVKAEKLSDLGGVCDYKTVFTETTDGEAVPACITNNTICDVENIEFAYDAEYQGIKVGIQVNDTQTYDFHVLSEDTDKNEITLIMDNTLGKNDVQWINKDDYLEAGGIESDWSNECPTCGNNNKGPLTALKELEKRTSNWTNIPLKTYTILDDNEGTPRYSEITITARARLATAPEVANHVTDFSWLYFHSDNSGLGYWTSSTGNSSYQALCVNSEFLAGYTDTITENQYGIRPVITISKTTI